MLDFIATLNIDVIKKVVLTDDEVTIPVALDTEEFFVANSANIDSVTLTHEKALSVAITNSEDIKRDAISMLNRKR